MAFRVATDCLEGEDARPISVFCSRYGEFSRAFEILSDLARDEPVSPMAFSLSVHNTASSLFSIMREDTSHSTALAAGEATLEAGFLECWSLLQEDTAQTALLVYSDQVLPELYADQETTVSDSAALAFLLRLPGGKQQAPALGLSWRSNRGAKAAVENSALRVLRLLLKGGDPIVLDTGRLTWTWSWHGSAA